ncbi:hypothetical protein DER46DRAFT_628622 [Fusarium sp. MPI-SDFR-AT-0072]|nr:hypothetical protein DER46DRAFT_628622 [Fusarium sp. MPI-SDFR-AT-0072]
MYYLIIKRHIYLSIYLGITTALISSSMLNVVHLIVKYNISCVLIINLYRQVLNAFKAVNIIPCIKGGAYDNLDGSVGEALCKRPNKSPDIYIYSKGN